MSSNGAATPSPAEREEIGRQFWRGFPNPDAAFGWADMTEVEQEAAISRWRLEQDTERQATLERAKELVGTPGKSASNTAPSGRDALLLQVSKHVLKMHADLQQSFVEIKRQFRQDKGAMVQLHDADERLSQRLDDQLRTRDALLDAAVSHANDSCEAIEGEIQALKNEIAELRTLVARAR